MFFNGSATTGLAINPSGTVASGDVSALAQSTADPTIIAQADHTNGSGSFNGDDALVLRHGPPSLTSLADWFRSGHRGGIEPR
jgi:hypothetical protein